MSGYEVGIIGAGIQGASIAYHLGRAGARTIVLERDTPAGGPTGRSSAACRSSYTNRFLARTAHEGIQMLEHLPEVTGGGDSGYRRCGVLHLHRPEDRDAARQLVGDLQGLGIEIENVDLQTAAVEHPQISFDGVGAVVWEPGGGYADPASSTLALLQDARRHGIEVRLHAPVTDIRARSTGGALLRTRDGALTACSSVVIAAGPWTAPLARRLGVELPLTVERHFVATYSWGEASPLPYVLGDVPGGYYLQPEGPEQFGLGSLLPEAEVDADDFEEGVGAEEALALAEPAIRRVPVLETAGFAGGWASLYDVSPDWQPVIGEIAPGIFVAAGTSGHGFKLAPALGRHIADMVLRDGHDDGLHQFSPDRFDRGVALDAGFGEARIMG